MLLRQAISNQTNVSIKILFRPSEKFFIFESGCGTVSNFLENIHPCEYLGKMTKNQFKGTRGHKKSV